VKNKAVMSMCYIMNAIENEASSKLKKNKSISGDKIS
jgi:hypothetical protein